MKSNFEMVREFHETYNCFIGDLNTWPTVDPQGNQLIPVRRALIEEEYTELLEAIENKDIVEVADALTDILYVVYGTGLSFGIDLDECFKEVHRSNMSKLGADGKPIYREDGKVLKGPKYSPPDLKKVLFDE